MSTLTFKQRLTIWPGKVIASLVALLAVAITMTVVLIATSGSSSTPVAHHAVAAPHQAIAPLIQYRGTGAPPASRLSGASVVSSAGPAFDAPRGDTAGPRGDYGRAAADTFRGPTVDQWRAGYGRAQHSYGAVP